MRGKKSEQAKKRILIVDDHPMMRDGLRQLIANESDLEVAGEADDVAAALEQAEKLSRILAETAGLTKV